MLKAALWTVIIVTVLIIGLGFAAARKSAGMSAPSVANGTLPPCKDTPNCVTTEVDSQHAAYIEPIPALITIDQLQQHIEALGGQVTNSKDTVLQAEFRTRLFRFIDDVTVKLDDTDRTFRIRSSSRVGKSDLGANRKRVEALRELIQNQAK